MSADTLKDWDPEAYERFRGFRLRPAKDLLAQIGRVPYGAIVDLGCGSGTVAMDLALKFSGQPMVGVDQSPEMLAKARETRCYTDLIEMDIAKWRAFDPVSVIFSNAALHWLAGHDTLLPALADMVMPGGVLAVQMPRQSAAPSHALLRRLAGDMFPDRFDLAQWEPPVWPAEDYARLLADRGEVSAWETTYVQRLAPNDHARHPVRAFTQSTAMRPFVEQMSDAERGTFVAAYEAELAARYPQEADGSVLFPFTRVFFVLER